MLLKLEEEFLTYVTDPKRYTNTLLSAHYPPLITGSTPSSCLPGTPIIACWLTEWLLTLVLSTTWIQWTSRVLSYARDHRLACEFTVVWTVKSLGSQPATCTYDVTSSVSTFIVCIFTHMYMYTCACMCMAFVFAVYIYTYMYVYMYVYMYIQYMCTMFTHVGPFTGSRTSWLWIQTQTVPSQNTSSSDRHETLCLPSRRYMQTHSLAISCVLRPMYMYMYHSQISRLGMQTIWLFHIFSLGPFFECIFTTSIFNLNRKFNMKILSQFLNPRFKIFT